MKQPIFQLSTDARVLASVLAEAEPGEIVTYDRLSKAIGRDVRTEAYGALGGARRHVQREKQMVFDSVRGSGLKRLADSEVVDLSDRTRDSVRRASRRAAQKLTCVDYKALPREKQTKHNASMSMFGVLTEMTTNKVQRRLESAVQAANCNGELPAAKAALAAFGAVLEASV